MLDPNDARRGPAPRMSPLEFAVAHARLYLSGVLIAERKGQEDVALERLAKAEGYIAEARAVIAPPPPQPQPRGFRALWLRLRMAITHAG